MSRSLSQGFISGDHVGCADMKVCADAALSVHPSAYDAAVCVGLVTWRKLCLVLGLVARLRCHCLAAGRLEMLWGAISCHCTSTIATHFAVLFVEPKCLLHAIALEREKSGHAMCILCNRQSPLVPNRPGCETPHASGLRRATKGFSPEPCT